MLFFLILLVGITKYVVFIMEYAIIESSGRQFWIEPGKFLEINKIDIPSGAKILLRRILFARKEEQILVGQPYLTDMKIEATVGKDVLGPKIIIYKIKPKKKYRRKTGHRQKLTRIFINNFIY